MPPEIPYSNDALTAKFSVAGAVVRSGLEVPELKPGAPPPPPHDASKNANRKVVKIDK